MKIEYDITNEKNEQLKESIELVFGEIFPDFFSATDDEKFKAEISIAIQAILKEYNEHGTNTDLDKYDLGEELNQLILIICRMLDSIEPKEDRDHAFELCDSILFSMIVSCVADGLDNGTITLEDLESEKQLKVM